MPSKPWTLAAVLVATFMLLLDVTIVNVALPEIQRDLGANLSDLQWVINAYALSLSVVLLTSGSLSDRVGRRLVFRLGLVLFTIASGLCALATDPGMLIAARALQGVGGAALLATSLALLADAFSGASRHAALAAWGAASGVSVAVGPLVGGALIELASWEWIFLVNLPVGVVALAMTLRVAESRQPAAGAVDWAGLVTFGGSLGAFVYALQIAADEGWGSTLVVGLLAAAALLMAGFVAIERRQRSPMLDVELFSKPTMVGASVGVFAVAAAAFALLIFLVLYLQNGLGYDALETGLRLLPLTVGAFVASAATARLAGRLGPGPLLGAGLLTVGTGLLLMRGLTAQDDWTALLAGLIVVGLGIGIANPAIAAAALGVVDAGRSGMASGISSTFRLVGVACGVAGLGTVFKDSVAEQVAAGAAQRAAFVAGLNDVLLVAAVVAFAGASAALLVRRRDLVVSDDSLVATA